MIRYESQKQKGEIEVLSGVLDFSPLRCADASTRAPGILCRPRSHDSSFASPQAKHDSSCTRISIVHFIGWCRRRFLQRRVVCSTRTVPGRRFNLSFFFCPTCPSRLVCLHRDQPAAHHAGGCCRKAGDLRRLHVPRIIPDHGRSEEKKSNKQWLQGCCEPDS